MAMALPDAGAGASTLTDRSGDALRRLLAGNRRYVDGRAGGRILAVRPAEVAGAQHPYAMVLGCVDSRVPPELVFDCGVGELLVVRTAGHVLDRAVLGSLELGVAELDVPLIVVLGHQRCGAVTAAVAAAETGSEGPDGELSYLLRCIRPAVRAGRAQPGDPVDNTVRAHAGQVAERLGSNAVIGERLRRGSLTVVAARYDLDSGRVDLLG